MIAKISPKALMSTALTLLMLTAYYTLVFFLVPQGVNAAFAARAWMLGVVVSILSAAFFLFFRDKTGSLSGFQNMPHKQAQIRDLVYVLIPMTPIAQYVVLNLDVLNGYDLLIIISFFLSLCLLFGVFGPWLLSRYGTKKGPMACGLGSVFFVFNMSFFSAQFNWHLSGNFIFQLFLLICVCVFMYILLAVRWRWSLIMVLVFFVLNVGFSALDASSDNPGVLQSNSTEPKADSQIDSAASSLEMKNR